MLISIHAPAKGATSLVYQPLSLHNYFNPRSREGSDYSLKSGADGEYDFNPRSREGSDCFHAVIFAVYTAISIHAPAKGATQHDTGKKVVNIFQSTLPRRERLCAQEHAKCVESFQSTLPRRERLFGRRCIFLPQQISIHAPAKGATSQVDEGMDIIVQFQSTLPRRERHVQELITGKSHGFQSTLPRRERRGITLSQDLAYPISIHAPAKGATTMQPVLWPARTISIHAPAKGATLRWVAFSVLFHHFNPRSREGSDLTRVYTEKHITRFQSTLPRRERPDGST